MKAIRIVLVLMAAAVLLTQGCYKNDGVDSGIPLFPYNKPLLYPPDTFMVVFNVATNGDKIAEMSLDTAGVWFIEKLGDGRVNFTLANEQMEVYYLNARDTVALEGGRLYYLIANNNNHPELNNYFVSFTKLGLNYAEFEPKF